VTPFGSSPRATADACPALILDSETRLLAVGDVLIHKDETAAVFQTYAPINEEWVLRNARTALLSTGKFLVIENLRRCVHLGFPHPTHYQFEVAGGIDHRCATSASCDLGPAETLHRAMGFCFGTVKIELGDRAFEDPNP
jgi:hypothetical protein